MVKVSIYNEHGADVDEHACKNFVKSLWRNERGPDADLNIIFVGHGFIKDLNQRFFNKTSSTDVIAFPLEDIEAEPFAGEVYVCIDQVRDNSEFYSTPAANELKRVVAHGLLHLLGYRDKTTAEAQEMRKKEDHYSEPGKEITIGI